MKTSDFDYNLPQELIAQEPLADRAAARMLVLDRQSQSITHECFRNLSTYLRPGDILVLNHTRVIPARAWAHKLPNGGKVELLLTKQLAIDTWDALVRGRKVPVGADLCLVGSEASNNHGPQAKVLAISESGGRILRFDQPIMPWLSENGVMPLPPYIHKKLGDPERYQTVYSQIPGSVAAPTAGLHFTEEVLNQLRRQGVQIETITLHVGLGTFRPVHEEEAEKHVIHSEWCEVNAETCARLNAAKAEGRRIIAIGTTTVRVLESAVQKAAENGVTDLIAPFSGETNLFIMPGFQFHMVDAMLTNFHLPRSTLLMLVSAFAGREYILHAYQAAVAESYRFFSFGDCMLII